MLEILVEDDISKFPYQLLKVAPGLSIRGCNGNNNFETEIHSSQHGTLVLVDLSPDNGNTVRAYRKAIDIASTLQNVFVVPIPCIEYCFLRAFFSSHNSDVAAVLHFVDYRKHTHDIYGKSLSHDFNYETFCKSVLKHQRPCLRNSVFVTRDCVCSKPLHNNLCEPLTLETKALKFLSSLPVYTYVEEPLSVTRQRVHRAITEGEALYYKMAEAFKSYGIIDTIPELPKNKVY